LFSIAEFVVLFQNSNQPEIRPKSIYQKAFTGWPATSAANPLFGPSQP
jgi:hypothetical protein